MSYETGTQTTPKALFDHIVAQLQSTAFMGAGNEWQLVYSFDGWGSGVSNADKVIKTFLCPGPTGTGDWYVSLRLEPSSGINTTNFLFGALKDGAVPPFGGATWTFVGTWSGASVAYQRGDVVLFSGQYYVCEVDHTSNASDDPNDPESAGIWFPISDTSWFGTFLSSANSHAIGYGKVWNGGPGDIKYWLMANASRVMWVTKSDTRYNFCYAGGFVRFGTATSYPLPTILCGNETSASETYLNGFNFPLRGGTSNNHAVSLKGKGSTSFSTAGNVWSFPPGQYGAPLAHLGRRPNGDYPLHPVVVARAATGICGTMDGVFVTDTRDSASENIITVAGQDYLVVEDVSRGQSGHFLALKLA